MGKVGEAITDAQAAWIAKQHLFFVGTAPLGGDGHVNVSPKGDLRWFRILGPREVAYLDFVGSGAETIAHVRENGRIVLMFCAFEGPPKIVRLHGTAEVLPATHSIRFQLHGGYCGEHGGGSHCMMTHRITTKPFEYKMPE